MDTPTTTMEGALLDVDFPTGQGIGSLGEVKRNQCVIRFRINIEANAAEYAEADRDEARVTPDGRQIRSRVQIISEIAKSLLGDGGHFKKRLGDGTWVTDGAYDNTKRRSLVSNRFSKLKSRQTRNVVQTIDVSADTISRTTSTNSNLTFSITDSVLSSLNGLLSGEDLVEAEGLLEIVHHVDQNSKSSGETVMSGDELMSWIGSRQLAGSVSSSNAELMSQFSGCTPDPCGSAEGERLRLIVAFQESDDECSSVSWSRKPSDMKTNDNLTLPFRHPGGWKRRSNSQEQMIPEGMPNNVPECTDNATTTSKEPDDRSLAEVIRILKSNGEDETFQRALLEEIHDLVLHESNQIRDIDERTGIPLIFAIAETMDRFRESLIVQLSAIEAIGILQSTSRLGRNFPQFTQQLAPRVVLAMATHPTNAELQKQGCIALPQSYYRDANLRSNEITAVLISQTTVSQLQQHLHDNSDLPMSIWETFFALTSRGTIHQSALVVAGAIPAIISIMTQRLDEKDVQKCGCEALHELAKDHPTNQLRIYKAGGISAILRSMKRHPDVLGWCDAAICNIICGLATHEDVSRSEVVAALLEETHPSRGTHPAYERLLCQILKSLASACPEYHCQCEVEGVLGRLVQS